MEIEKMIPLILGILTVANAWLLWAATEAKKERKSMQDEVRQNVQDLSDFKLKVTQEYVRTSNLKEIEDRLISAIDRLAERLDRLFEQKKQ